MSNPYEMSMDELRLLAESSELPPPEAEPVVEQPRDEQGRFVAAQPEVEQEIEQQGEPEGEVQQEEPEQYYHREEIDNEQGGKEVFTGIGASPEEAVHDCLRQIKEGKWHANKKIRELSQHTAPAPTAPSFNPDEEMHLAQEILAEPSKAIDKILTNRFGMTPEQLKAKLAEAEEAAKVQKSFQAQDEFVAATPDFYPDQYNGRKMLKWLQVNQMDVTVENLNTAYQDLKSEGLLKTKPAPQPATDRPRSSGVSVRRAAPPVVNPAVAAKKTREMSLEELREAAGGYQPMF